MVEALWTDCENRAKAIGDLATRYHKLKALWIIPIHQADTFQPAV